jgi:hypothetical protein
MERWAANTLRTLGIILTAGFVMVASLLLLLLSICASSGDFSGNKQPGLVVPYLIAGVAVLVLGLWFIVWLARGISRSSAEGYWPTPPSGLSEIGALAPEPAVEARPAAHALPLHLSPLGRKAVDRLVLALGAQIVLSAAAWIFNQLHFWTRPQAFAPHNWTLVLLAPFILYHVPYAILIYVLLKRPDRRAFTYSIAVPAVLILQSLFSLGLVTRYYVHQPMGLLLLFLPWAIHIVILVLAYQAIQQVGLHPQPSSLIVAAIVSFFFFSFIHALTPFLYRFR